MSNKEVEKEKGCMSEVTVAINRSRISQVNNEPHRSLDSPDSDVSEHSQSFTVQSYDYHDNTSFNHNSGIITPIISSEDLRVPIVGYEVMEERARFTIYKLRVELKSGDCWFVFRRYTDFVRLLSQLKRQKLSTSHLVLPRKKWIGDNFAPSFLEERIKGLQKFVNDVLNTPNLTENHCIREFFCLNDPPALSDTAEEGRAIFEALEETIYYLKQKLRERDAALALQTSLCNQLQKKLDEITINNLRLCSMCSKINTE